MSKADLVFAQMREDHERDAEMMANLGRGGLFASMSHGEWMWFATTCGYNTANSEKIVLKASLLRKYPKPHRYWKPPGA